MTAELKPRASDTSDVAARVRSVLQQYGRLSRDVPQLADSDDLYEAGLTSHASVNVMLALESEFNVEFPDQMLNRAAFSSVAAIRAAIEELVAS